MDKRYDTIFTVPPKQTFGEFLHGTNADDRYDEAVRLLESAGYTVMNEGAMAKWIAGLALSFGLMTNAAARDFNAQASTGYVSGKANTSMFSKDIRKDYNLKSDIQLTDAMVQNIVDNIAKKIANRMLEEDKYEEDELVSLDEWKCAVSFYRQLSRADESLGNMFSRRLDKALTQSIRIAPNIQRYANRVG